MNNKSKMGIAVIISYIVGWRLLFKLMSIGEYRAVDTYAPVIGDFPEVESVQRDDGRHGDILTNLL